MDITLQQTSEDTYVFDMIGFNPYFNGYYTSTHKEFYLNKKKNKVLILILMDITLQHDDKVILKNFRHSFNPYFNGYYTSTY